MMMLGPAVGTVQALVAREKELDAAMMMLGPAVGTFWAAHSYQPTSAKMKAKASHNDKRNFLVRAGAGVWGMPHHKKSSQSPSYARVFG